MTVFYNKNVPWTSVDVYDQGTPPTKTTTTDAVVDSGAGESMLPTSAFVGGSTFVFQGAAAVQTAAGVGTVIKVKGATMKFKAVPKGGGAEVDVSCSVQVAVGPVPLLGNDQLAEADCSSTNNPKAKSGSINKNK